ncbi:hypothetical protein NPIL_376841 [Nephila pilipes]|uniref:Uncharacterized protein n=1 Tax=Nephila pilipes TaxID=299642 RepID=A0A8X6N1W6_NEPPI|nr:hypothetical protein NPIL_376841 [Nephila pilipes]
MRENFPVFSRSEHFNCFTLYTLHFFLPIYHINEHFFSNYPKTDLSSNKDHSHSKVCNLVSVQFSLFESSHLQIVKSILHSVSNLDLRLINKRVKQVHNRV